MPCFASSFPRAYMSFRILLTGPTSSNSLFLVLSGIELYGTLLRVPSEKGYQKRKQGYHLSHENGQGHRPGQDSIGIFVPDDSTEEELEGVQRWELPTGAAPPDDLIFSGGEAISQPFKNRRSRHTRSRSLTVDGAAFARPSLIGSSHSHSPKVAGSPSFKGRAFSIASRTGGSVEHSSPLAVPHAPLFTGGGNSSRWASKKGNLTVGVGGLGKTTVTSQ